MRPAIPRSVSTGDHLTPASHAESHASRHAARHAHPMPLVASGDPVSPTASIRPNRIRRRRWRTLDGRAPGPPPSARHHHEITTLHQRPRTGHRRHVEAASRRHSEPHALRVTGRRGQRHDIRRHLRRQRHPAACRTDITDPFDRANLPQPVGMPVHADLPLAHGLQHGELRLRIRTVDLVGDDDIGEQRSRMEIERTGGLRIHAAPVRSLGSRCPPTTSVITASSITSREHDSTPASASMMSPMTAADMAGVSIAMSSSAPPLLSIPVARTTPVGPADSPRQRGAAIVRRPIRRGTVR